jgi:hypothetical protein
MLVVIENMKMIRFVAGRWDKSDGSYVTDVRADPASGGDNRSDNRL